MSKLTVYCDNELIDGLLLADCVYKTLKQKVNLSAEISFCEEDEIRALNRKQRNKVNSIAKGISSSLIIDDERENNDQKNFSTASMALV